MRRLSTDSDPALRDAIDRVRRAQANYEAVLRRTVRNLAVVFVVQLLVIAALLVRACG